MNASRLGIVVVNYGSHALVAANLPAETAAAAAALVVIVDNFHSAEERQAVEMLCDERGWVLVPSENRGFGAGVNAGVKAAIEHGCDVLLALNPDARLSAEVMTALAENCRREPLALISPIVTDSEGARVFRGSQVNLETGEMRGGWPENDEAPWRRWLTGACMAFHRDAFEAAGGMNEQYFLYWEDVDFSLRAADAGVRLILRDDLVAVHDEGGTHTREDSRAKSPLYYFYNTRNRLIFARDHAAPGQLRRWVLATPRQSAKIWLRGGRKQLLTQPAGLVAAARGSVSGVASTLRKPVEASSLAQTSKAPAQAHTPTVVMAHPSPDLYGSDRVLLESVSAFVASGFDVVVALPAEGPLWEAIRERGGEVTLCPTPVLRKSYLSPTGLVHLAAAAGRSVPPALALIRDRRPELVFVNTVTIPSWLAVARASRTPVVCHVHEAEKSQSRAVRRVLYAPLLMADWLVVNSQFSLDVLADAWPRLRTRSTVVYNGVPGPTGPTGPIDPPRAVVDEARLLFLGRLSPRKGPHVAVEALALLRDAGIPARLSLLGAVFPGYEWYEEQLRARVDELGLTDQVTFLGFDPAIWEHMAACDIVLVPSTVDEPFGNTAVEAMLAQRPLVVSATSGLMEAAADYLNARRVEPENAAAIADAVTELLASWPEVLDRVEADRQLALDRHAPEVYQRTLVDVARTRTADHPPAPAS